MSLVGLEFVYFLPLVWILYWVLPRRPGFQNALLLAGSYLFYASWSWKLLVLLAAGTVLDFLIARGLDAEADPPRTDGRRRWLLGFSVAFSLGALAFFKYETFFAGSLNRLFSAAGWGGELPVLRLLLPLGISYYTLTRLSYMIDVYYGRIRACRSLVTFALFASFFPQLTAGPITRGGEMLPQMSRARTLRPGDMAAGASSFLLGYVMKAYVANWIGPVYVDPVFADPTAYASAAIWLALWAFSIQVFCDFAGYSFLAIGVGRLFGLELPENFRRPFLSRNMREFWTRWHITLNNWLFDYLYWPMVAGRTWMRGRLDLGFVVVFLISGLWHGAAWTFLLWGLLQGLALVAHHRWDELYKKLCRRDRRWVRIRKGVPYGLAAWALTQLFFLVSLLPFRAGSLASVGTLARRMFVPSRGEILPLFSFNLALSVLFLLFYHLPEFGPGRWIRARYEALPDPVRGVALGLAVVFLFLFVPVGVGAFIYGGF